MKRERFLFKESSRVYRQATALALNLRQRFRQNESWFGETAKLLAAHGLTTLQNDQEWRRAIEYAKNNLDSIASTIDPRIAVPALIEAVDDFYYRDPSWREDLSICGSALKVSIAMIWPNRRLHVAVDRSSSKLQSLVVSAMAWQQLVDGYEKFQVFERESVRIEPYGLVLPSEKDEFLRQEWNEMAASYGASQRTLEQSKAVIYRDPLAFSKAVSRVLNGEKSNAVELFEGTVFSLAGENPAFWLGLKARLRLLQLAVKLKVAGSSIYTGVVLFEEFQAELGDFGPDPVQAQRSIEACFWGATWYDRQVKEFSSDMLVERPVLRIDDRTFATSVLTIIDSINGFVENSVFGYAELGGERIKEKAFQVYISQPFENSAIALFREKGWRVSGVTNAGYWAAGSFNLKGTDGRGVPGEIDVLALHPTGVLAIVIECKILSRPHTRGKLKNIIGKLGSADQEKFHSNLERKMEWIAGVPEFGEAQVFGALLVDQGRFLGYGSPNLVLDMTSLAGFIDEIEEEIAGCR